MENINDYQKCSAKYDDYIRSILSEERYKHSVKVAQMCELLAKTHGENPEKAYMVGILHDIRKEADREIQLEETLLWGADVSDVEKETSGLWHAVSGAYFCKNTFKIDDVDVLNAIRFHTVARAGMSLLEKIVYLGDKVSLDRDEEDKSVEKLRKAAIADVNDAMYQTLKSSIIRTVSKKNGKIPHFTFEAYNYYLGKKG